MHPLSLNTPLSNRTKQKSRLPAGHSLVLLAVYWVFALVPLVPLGAASSCTVPASCAETIIDFDTDQSVQFASFTTTTENSGQGWQLMTEDNTACPWIDSMNPGACLRAGRADEPYMSPAPVFNEPRDRGVLTIELQNKRFNFTDYPGTFSEQRKVSFDLSVATEYDYDMLEFYVNGKEVKLNICGTGYRIPASGCPSVSVPPDVQDGVNTCQQWNAVAQNQWITVEHYLWFDENNKNDFYTFTWVFRKDSSISKCEDIAYIDNIKFEGLVLDSAGDDGSSSNDFSFDMEDGLLPPFQYEEVQSAEGWQVATDPHDSTNLALRSGQEGSGDPEDNANVTMKIVKTLKLGGEQQVSFRIHVDTEFQDIFVFTIDGMEYFRAEGYWQWQPVFFQFFPTVIPTVFEWTYSKNDFSRSGRDVVFVDDILITGLAPYVTTIADEGTTTVATAMLNITHSNYDDNQNIKCLVRTSQISGPIKGDHEWTCERGARCLIGEEDEPLQGTSLYSADRVALALPGLCGSYLDRVERNPAYLYDCDGKIHDFGLIYKTAGVYDVCWCQGETDTSARCRDPANYNVNIGTLNLTSDSQPPRAEILSFEGVSSAITLKVQPSEPSYVWCLLKDQAVVDFPSLTTQLAQWKLNTPPASVDEATATATTTGTAATTAATGSTVVPYAGLYFSQPKLSLDYIIDEYWTVTAVSGPNTTYGFRSLKENTAYHAFCYAEDEDGNAMTTERVRLTRRTVKTGFCGYIRMKQLDSFPTEIGWELMDTNCYREPNSYQSASGTQWDVCCIPPGTYTLRLKDSYGDGWNGGILQMAFYDCKWFRTYGDTDDTDGTRFDSGGVFDEEITIPATEPTTVPGAAVLAECVIKEDCNGGACMASQRGDGACQQECRTADCNWDDGDCDITAPTLTYSSVFGLDTQCIVRFTVNEQ
ncbi:unnamed protein product [Vitrella brassicaformis CCMP3155]|uniref:LNR domain-containing protein n=1 Tax=Vitrella brassicaformis (strain CCMP3155) TaxID=1169540 RepID=A0A0G4EIA7_VITBC|nr:unnamed protein product [Vitrella brassicaformis CCMP3155]|eukprot:CEL95716.1 unnamed protein product [Vitrella brassicaformis CCMP3155]